ncbi:MAG TPA: hypothetical protein VKB75_15120 [Jatrophihabitans sp.]|nr:hypothetical protein [Jatrophihabitans sp.]
MSVLVAVKIKGDTDLFEKALADRAAEFAEIAERGRSAGAIHHRFGIGDGYVLVVDEWETAEQFQDFFTTPELQLFIGSVGGDTSAPPEMTVSRAVSSSDEF